MLTAFPHYSSLQKLRFHPNSILIFQPPHHQTVHSLDSYPNLQSTSTALLIPIPPSKQPPTSPPLPSSNFLSPPSFLLIIPLPTLFRL
ncbi:hypothetical protein K469DRAFT_705396 [Zopfia rhizophila CBS 207.26]|uniref:Uncharacterized protein n=1 Tax=Zopfia rhizophila CBS 207.26 TaxID=1314779 RepID=A0A6A6E7W5_9PEZI|nr:hypothetical protein K469DRAFT_705396 [Zopfia rhizophila CBS 207.26]